jgi:hypothetical protein
MTPDIAPGTPCFLVNLVEMEALVGRVVVVAAPIPTPDGEAGSWFRVDADWARVMFDGREMQAPRRHLRPIVPPEPALPAASKRITERTAQ